MGSKESLMAELRDGEKSWDHVLKPGVGFYTFKAIRDFLKVHTSQLHKYCEELGIELQPFVRSEALVQKTYRRKYRWLTEHEARRLLEHHHRRSK
jgi:hypothetical protein